MTDLPFADHDHSHCTSGVLGHADKLAEEKGLRLTPVRCWANTVQWVLMRF